MAVKVMIKRAISPEKEKTLVPLLRKMRITATNQSGYISGETLEGVDNPGISMVISIWHTLEDWQRWHSNPERAAIQNQIDSLIGVHTEYAVYKTI